MAEKFLFHIQVSNTGFISLFMHRFFLTNDIFNIILMYLWIITTIKLKTIIQNVYDIHMGDQVSQRIIVKKTKWSFYPPTNLSSREIYRNNRLSPTSYSSINTETNKLNIVVPLKMVYQQYPKIIFLNSQNICHRTIIYMKGDITSVTSSI